MRIHLFCLFLGLASLTTRAAVNNDPIVDRLQAYLDQKDYFRLKMVLAEEAPHLPDHTRTYFQAFVDNAFADNVSSMKAVKTLLQTDTGLTEKQQYALWSLQEDNYYKIGEYRLARESCDTILHRYADGMIWLMTGCYGEHWKTFLPRN